MTPAPEHSARLWMNRDHHCEGIYWYGVADEWLVEAWWFGDRLPEEGMAGLEAELARRGIDPMDCYKVADSENGWSPW